MGSFGGIEWLVIILVVLLLFGAKKIPELARGLGQGLTEFRKASSDIRKEIEKGTEEPTASERTKKAHKEEEDKAPKAGMDNTRKEEEDKAPKGEMDNTRKEDEDVKEKTDKSSDN